MQWTIDSICESYTALSIPERMLCGFRSLPIPGEVFRLNTICADAKLNHNDRAHPLYAGLRGESPITILTEWYINHDWHSDDDDVPPLGNYDRDDDSTSSNDDDPPPLVIRGGFLPEDGDQSNPQQPPDDGTINQSTAKNYIG